MNTEDIQAYRLHYLRQDARFLVFFYGLSIVFNILSVRVDRMLVGAEGWLAWLLANRMIMVGLSAWAILVARKTRLVKDYDRAALVWGIGMALLYLPILFSRPSTYVYNTILDVTIVMGLYIVMPDIPRLRALPGLIYSGVSLFGVFVLRQPLDGLSEWYILLAFFTANLGGFLVTETAFAARRSAWFSSRELSVMANERAELLEMKNRLISTLSHEVRNPLNVITSSANLLNTYLDNLSSQQRLSVLKRLTGGTTRLNEILERVIYVYRGDDAQLDLRLQERDIQTWLAHVTDECRGLYPECEVHTQVQGCPRRHAVDTFLIWLILSNLVANACKFAPAAPKHLYLTCDVTGMQIRVVDHGPGMSPGEKKHVFEPFFRGTDTQHIEGLGMGLSIVQEAVSLLDGSIDLQSRPGQTSVTVRLPWLKQDAIRRNDR